MRPGNSRSGRQTRGLQWPPLWLREAGPKPDLDLLIELESDRSLLDQIALGQDLEDLFGCQVDFVTEKALHW